MKKIILTLIFILISSVSFADGHSGKISLAGFFVGDAKAIVDEKGNVIPHPDRHTIAPEGAITKLTKLESAKINHESMVEGKDNIIDI